MLIEVTDIQETRTRNSPNTAAFCSVQVSGTSFWNVCHPYKSTFLSGILEEFYKETAQVLHCLVCLSVLNCLDVWLEILRLPPTDAYIVAVCRDYV